MVGREVGRLRRLTELDQQRGEPLRVGVVRHVTGVREDLEAAPGHRVVRCRAVTRRDDRVLLTPDDQRRQQARELEAVVGADALAARLDDRADRVQERLSRHDAAIKRLARVESVSLAGAAPKGAAQIVIGEATACLPLGSLIDLSAEKARLEKAIAKTDGEMSRVKGKLSNEKFVANANPGVVEAERERLAEFESQMASLKVALARVIEA